MEEEKNKICIDTKLSVICFVILSTTQLLQKLPAS